MRYVRTLQREYGLWALEPRACAAGRCGLARWATQLWFVRLAVFALFFGLPLARAQDMATVQVAQQAQVRLMPQGGPETSQRMDLPHRWDSSFPRDDGQARYELHFPDIPAQRPLALYFPFVGNQAEIAIGGSTIARVGKLGDSSQDAVKGPLIVDLPPWVVLGDQGLRVTVHIGAQFSRYGGLSRVYLGSRDSLAAMHNERVFWRQWVSLAVAACTGFAALLALSLWWVSRMREYALFGWAFLFGTIRYADRVVTLVPVPWMAWGAVSSASLGTYVVLVCWFGLVVTGNFKPWMQRPLVAMLAVQVGLAVLTYSLRVPALWTLALITQVTLSWVTTMKIVRTAWRERQPESIFICLAATVMLAAATRDFFVVRWNHGTETVGSYQNAAAIVLILLLAWIVVNRYARHARAHQELLRTLEHRIQEKEQQLQRTHAALQEEREQRAALRERQRIMRDIHDGVGAHLVGLMAFIDGGHANLGSVRDQADATLQELRMAVDAMQPSAGDLGAVLAMLRYRLEPRLRSTGIVLHWYMDEIPPVSGISSATALHLQRVVMEAITNVLKHAQATQLWLTVRYENGAEGGSMVVEIRDDGVGFDSETPTLGHGMRNMQARAQQIGAALSVQSHKGQGSLVKLVIPLKMEVAALD